MARLHSTRFSASSAVQVPLAVASAMVGNSQLLNVTGMVNLVARWATMVVLCTVLELFIILTCVYLLRRLSQKLLPDGGDCSLHQYVWICLFLRIASERYVSFSSDWLGNKGATVGVTTDGHVAFHELFRVVGGPRAFGRGFYDHGPFLDVERHLDGNCSGREGRCGGYYLSFMHNGLST